MPAPRVNEHAETAALWARMTDNEADAQAIIRDMLPAERASFLTWLDDLRSMTSDRSGNDITQ